MPRPRPLALLLLVALAGCTRKYVRETTREPIAPTPERLARGAYLVDHVSACGSCHTTRDSGRLTDPERRDRYLGGGNVIESLEPRMRVSVPNITSDPETGVGRWSDDQLLRAIRDGIDDEGRILLPLMPYSEFRHLSDEDARAVVAYLRSAPRVRQERKPIDSEVSFFVRFAIERLGVTLHPPARDVTAPPRGDPVRQGEYLLHAAGCSDCHSLGSRGPRAPDDRWLAGSDVPFGEGGKVWAPNLTPDRETGIGRAAPAAVKRALREGVRLDGKRMAPPMSILVPHYAGMTEEDLDALVAYLESVRPVRHKVPERQLDAATRSRLGE